jgi:hypothetical protein
MLTAPCLCIKNAIVHVNSAALNKRDRDISTFIDNSLERMLQIS